MTFRNYKPPSAASRILSHHRSHQIVESLQSHFILTMRHWPSGLPVCFPSHGTQVQIPWGVLMWNRDSPVSNVSLHWWPRRDWSFLWPRLQRASSRMITRPSCLQCDNPSWSHIAFLSRFHARCRSSFRLHNHRVGCWGGALWRACNLTSFSPCLTGPVDYLFASHHKGLRFKSPGGYLCETGILLLVLSRYKVIKSQSSVHLNKVLTANAYLLSVSSSGFDSTSAVYLTWRKFVSAGALCLALCIVG